MCPSEETYADIGGIPDTSDPLPLFMGTGYSDYADWATYSLPETPGLGGFLVSENQVTPL